MKQSILLFLLTWANAFALDPYYLGEWKEVGKKSYLFITEKYFIFRTCNRFMVLDKSTEHEAVLFTGRENWCLGRGEHRCKLKLDESKELNLDCGNDYQKTYRKEIRQKEF